MTKSLVFFLKARCRKAKMLGSARQVRTVLSAIQLVHAGRGSIFVVDCETAARGRTKIAAFRAGRLEGSVTMDGGGRQFVVIGTEAEQRVRACESRLMSWETVRKERGIVPVSHTVVD